MSGKLGTGLNTKTIHCEKIEKYFGLKIKDIIIPIISLSFNNHFHRLKYLESIYKISLHQKFLQHYLI